MSQGLAREPVIWIISRDHWPRALLRAELIERGYDAVGYFEVEDAIGERTSRAPDLIVVDLADQERQRLARLFDLAAPIIALGSAADFSQSSADQLNWSAVMRRPYSLGEVADRVSATLSRR